MVSRPEELQTSRAPLKLTLSHGRVVSRGHYLRAKDAKRS